MTDYRAVRLAGTLLPPPLWRLRGGSRIGSSLHLLHTFVLMPAWKPGGACRLSMQLAVRGWGELGILSGGDGRARWRVAGCEGRSRPAPVQLCSRVA